MVGDLSPYTGIPSSPFQDNMLFIGIDYTVTFPPLPDISAQTHYQMGGYPYYDPGTIFTTYAVGIDTFWSSTVGCISNFSSPGPGGSCNYYTSGPLYAFVTKDNPSFVLAWDGDFLNISFDFSAECFTGNCGFTFLSANAIAASVPEPSTLAMMILGFVGIGAITYHRRKARCSPPESPDTKTQRPLSRGFSFCSLNQATHRYILLTQLRRTYVGWR